MALTIKLQGLKEMLGGSLELTHFLQTKKFRLAVSKFGFRVERDSRQLVPKKSRFLKSSITHSIPGGVVDQIVFGSSLKYAAPVEFGWREITIVPKHKKILKFRKEGEEKLRYSVRRPSHKEMPYLRPAILKNLLSLHRDIKQAAEDTLKGGK